MGCPDTITVDNLVYYFSAEVDFTPCSSVLDQCRYSDTPTMDFVTAWISKTDPSYLGDLMSIPVPMSKELEKPTAEGHSQIFLVQI